MKKFILHKNNIVSRGGVHHSKLWLLLALAVLASIFSCRQTAKGNETPKPVKIASISVKPSAITLKKGETSTLKAVVLPKEAPQEVKWESDKPEIATVDEKGVITAKEVGTAHIKVTSLKDATKTATCEVTVAETHFDLEKIEVEPTAIPLKKGKTRKINLIISPSNATNVSENWESSAPATVSVDDKGNITANEVGNATITVTVKQPKEGGAETVKTATCAVTVTETEIALEAIKIDPSDTTVKRVDTKELTIKLSPKNATNVNVECKSDAPDKVSVDKNIISIDKDGNGKVEITAKKEGEAIITVTAKQTSEDGTEITKTATCKVTVIPPVPVESVSLDKDVLELAYENSETLIATVKPDTASQEVIWSSSNETVATCSPNGVVTAKKKKGKITITATSKTDPSKKATCTVYVAEEKIESISFIENPSDPSDPSNAKKTIDIVMNTTADFNIYTKPWNATDELDFKGTGILVSVIKIEHPLYGVRGYTVRAGDLPSNLDEKEEKITFWSKARPDLKAVLKIKIKRPAVERITLKDKKIGLTDYTHKMEAIVFPQKAWQEVTWTSKNKNIVKIDEEGVLDPKGPGTATIVATAKDGSGVYAEATVTVETAAYGVRIDKSAIYYGSEDATLTITKSQAGSTLDYNFEMESDKASDLDIKRVSELVFKIKVKNKKARTAEAKLTIKSRNFSDATRYAYINIKTIIPEAISIEGDDKMYLNETLRFDIDTTKKDSSHPEPNKKVRWEWDNSYSTSGVGAGDFEITQNGTVRLKNPSSNQIGKSFRIKAILDLDNSVVATKVITIYPNIAKITNARMLTGEWSMCDRENEIEHNGLSYSTWGAVLCELESLDNIYNKFVVSEESSPTDIPESSYFESTKYESEERQGKARIQLSYPKDHTSSKHVTFYVWPIDPKTEKPAIVGQNNTFDFRIWAKPTGIEFQSVNFAIEKYKDDVGRGEGWRNKGYINEEYTWKRFEVRVIPQHANPNLLKFTTKRGKEEDSDTEARHDCISENDPITLSDTPDGSGWRTLDFKLRKKTGWYRNRTDFCFCLALSPASYTTNAKIKAYMHVIQDSGW
jgi:hypothetical protein